MAFVTPTQACQTGYASRLRLEQTSLFVATRPLARKRASTHINYAEFDDDFEDEDAQFEGSNGDSPGSEAHKSEVSGSEIKKAAQRTKHATYTQDELNRIANREEILVPIRISLDFEQYKITDFFMWNIKETELTPEQFAIITCADLDLPVGYTNNIASSIKSQIQEYSELASIKIPEADGINVIIHLDLMLGNQIYEDKFEWDMNGDLSPEEFARTVVTDMGISGEFYPAIAHALHESLLRQKREILEGHQPKNINNQAAFDMRAGWRYDHDHKGEDWGPTVETLTPEELERRDMERERTLRRMKRESARFNAEVDLGSFSRFKRRRRESPAIGSPW